MHQAELPPVQLQVPTASLTHLQLVPCSDTSQRQATQKGDTESHKVLCNPCYSIPSG